MIYHVYFFVGKRPKFFNFLDSMTKSNLADFKMQRKKAFYGLQKIVLDSFPRNFSVRNAITNDACKPRNKIGPRTKYKCFPQVLFLVEKIYIFCLSSWARWNRPVLAKISSFSLRTSLDRWQLIRWCFTSSLNSDSRTKPLKPLDEPQFFSNFTIQNAVLHET